MNDRRKKLAVRILRCLAIWNPTSSLSAGVRVRSGPRNSQQSPPVTFKDFNDNPTGGQDMLLDRYFPQARRGGVAVWGARNDLLPLFKQNELFWEPRHQPEVA